LETTGPRKIYIEDWSEQEEAIKHVEQAFLTAGKSSLETLR
jgi:hypothetical protein